MYNAILMELDTNISFDCDLENLPIVKQNFSIVFNAGKKIKRPTSIEKYGQIKIIFKKINKIEKDFINSWLISKKKINLMIETSESIYMLKRSYIKECVDESKTFSIFYNDFEES